MRALGWRVWTCLASLAVSAAANPSKASAPGEAGAQAIPMADGPGSAHLSPPDTAGRPPGLAIVFSCVLQVEESDLAARAIIARAESLGGWFTRRAKSGIDLRIPSSRVDAFIAGLSALGVPLDRNLSTESLEGERAELASRLKARRAMLQDYYSMLKESGDSTLFTIQSEIVNLQTEIEQTGTQIGKLEDRMAFAQATIHFRFFERGAPLATGRSRFGWLNRLDLPALMDEFPHD